jgi:hypothetical protein
MSQNTGTSAQASRRDDCADAQLLALVRGTHTAVYLVMVAAIFVLLYSGVSGYAGPWLWVSLGLLGVESAVFAGNGLKCPLTQLAVRFGAVTGYAFDSYLPERVTRHTFRFFGSLMGIGLLLLAARWIGVLG